MRGTDDQATDLLKRLPVKGRKGSKARCHLLAHGARSDVADRFNTLVAPFATITTRDRWMPDGFDCIEEAQLHKAPLLLPQAAESDLISWWLAKPRPQSNTPNIDLASTCTVRGVEGILLVEAKAHHHELSTETKGKAPPESGSDDSQKNHDQIGKVIETASQSLTRSTSLTWSLSRDSCYQMSNRFAWAWKLADMGIPVVLVYLGFIDAIEMADGRRTLIADHPDWERHVLKHSSGLFPSDVWGRELRIGGCTVTPVVRSMSIPLPL